jgi:putative membrane protein
MAIALPAGSRVAARAWRIVAPLMMLVALAAPAFAHGGLDSPADALSAWRPSWDVTLPTLIVAGIYLAGLIRAGRAGLARQGWRPAAFLGGLGALWIALQSPIEPLSDHLFAMHQVEHLLLRMVAPMLLVLAVPQGALIRGLPDWAWERGLKRLFGVGWLRRVFGALLHPYVATSLFIATLYVWQVPAWHDAAVLDEGLHDVMHVTMLVTALLFWALVFDPRPPGQGVSFAKRLMMLWLALLAEIVLGAYITLTDRILYHAYEVYGRLWGISALGDQEAGGAILWIPGGMMFLIAVLLIVHRWGKREARGGDPWLRPAVAGTSGPTMAARGRNRQLAVGLTTFVAFVFLTALAVGLAVERHAF